MNYLSTIKKTFTFLYLFNFYINNLSAQNTDYDLHNQYWYYKARLHNDFMSVGTNAGQSIPLGQRAFNPKTYPNTYFNTNDLKAGDAAVQLGIYVGVLATEYRLLKDKGEHTTKVKHELFCALNAINRIDYFAEPTISQCPHDKNFNAAQGPNLNGFFMRDDIDSNFVMRHYNELNYYNTSINNNGNVVDAAGNPILTTNRALTPSNMATDRGFTSFKPGGQYYTQSGYQSFVDPTNIYNNRDYWNDQIAPKKDGHLHGFEESQDQLYYLLLGVALTAKLVDDGETDNGTQFLYGSGETSLKQEAKNIADRLISHVKNSAGGLWRIRNPANGNAFVQIGDPATLYSYALDNAGGYIKTVGTNQAEDFPSWTFLNPYLHNPTNDYRNIVSFTDVTWSTAVAGTNGGPLVDFQGFYHSMSAIANCTMENRNYLNNLLQAAIDAVVNTVTNIINIILDKIGNLPGWLQHIINSLLSFIDSIISFMQNAIDYFTGLGLKLFRQINTTEERLIYNNYVNGVNYNGCQSNGPIYSNFGSKSYFGIFAYRVLHPFPQTLPNYLQYLGQPLTTITYPQVKADLRNILESAPCEGNYNFGSLARPGSEWGASNRLDRMDPIYRYNIGCQTEFLGEYHGLDFMLLHNLYYLAEKNESSANSPTVINDQDDRLVNNTFPIGSAFNKANPNTKGAFEYLTSNSTINSNGAVSFRAGKIVNLQPGFTAKAGADFRAYIDPYHCASTMGTYEGAINKVANTQTNDSYNMTESAPKTKPTKKSTESNLPQALNNEQLNQIQNLTLQLDSLVKATEPILNTLDSKIIVYPNPNNGVFNIAFNLAKEDNVNLQILDANGREVYAHKYVVGEIEYPFNFTSYPKGIYMILANGSKGQVFTQKITIN